MNSNSRIDVSAFSKNSTWFYFWGAVLTILGIAAISASFVATMISVVFIGIVILIAGAVIILDSITFWWGKWSGFFLHFLTGLLYFAIGFMLIDSPVLGSVSITLLLGIFYLVVGIFRVTYALTARSPKWGWNFFNALVTLLLGVLILTSWPASSLFIIGLFVGIDLVFAGMAYLMAASSGRAYLKR
jgi:uncharacterized membrane protein HdeD (DUF308 family)